MHNTIERPRLLSRDSGRYVVKLPNIDIPVTMNRFLFEKYMRDYSATLLKNKRITRAKESA